MERDQIEAIFEEAAQSLDNGTPALALEKLDQLDGQLVDADDRIEWATMRAWACSELRRIDEALDLLEPLIEEFPESARLFGTLGVVLSNADDLSAAADALERAHTLDPEDETTIANLALVYERLREYRRAASLYDRAIDMGINIDWALQRKAASLADAGEYDEAKRTLKRYLSLAPDDASQWIELGLLHADDEEYDAALGCFEHAEKIAPDDPEVRLHWGFALAAAGKTDGARAQLAELHRLEPDSVRPALLEAKILEKENNHRSAEQAYERALAELNGEHAHDDLTLALEMAMEFFARRGKRQRCESLLKRAYDENSCTVELCEAYRDSSGQHLTHAYWLSVIIEADYRSGLRELYERGAKPEGPFARYQRNIQVVAKDRDDGLAAVQELLGRMGEKHVRVREIIREEPLRNAYAGLYEIERDALVFGD